jgi:biotin carboxyl carrier protein
VNFTGTFREGDREHAVSLTLRDGVLRGTHNGAPVPDLRVERRGGGLLLARVLVARDGSRVLVHLDGRVHELEIADLTSKRREKAGKRHHAGDEPFVASPMTGTVMQVPVKAGDAVAAGGTLAVVEAMKMQFVVRAPRAVVVKAVRVAAGQSVDIGGVLVEFVE